MSFQATRVLLATTLTGIAAVIAVQSSGVAAARPSPMIPTSGPVQQTHAFMTADAATGKVPILYVSDKHNAAVYLYNANRLGAGPIATITDGVNTLGGPGGMTVDGVGNLYVVAPLGIVEVFAPGSLHPARTIQFAGRSLASVAASADGTLAIFGNGGFEQDGTLFIFDKGSLTPTRTIDIPIDSKDANFVFTEHAVFVDASDRVFFSVGRYSSGDGAVEEFLPGSTQPIFTSLLRGGAIGFDASGNYYAGLAFQIDAFAAGSASQSRFIRQGITSQAFFTVLPDGTLFVPNIATQIGRGDVVEYAPGASRPTATIRTSDDIDPFATAYRPALR
jgi:hypothetical protein